MESTVQQNKLTNNLEKFKNFKNDTIMSLNMHLESSLSYLVKTHLMEILKLILLSL